MKKIRSRNPLSKKVLLSLAALGAAGAMAGLGTFATFTSTTSASHTSLSGTVAISVGTTATQANRFSEGSSTLVPGDSVQRTVDLISTSTSGDLGPITMTSAVTSASSLLDSDVTNGLQLVIDSCPANWTEAGSASARTYTCSGGVGTIKSVLASRAVIGSALALNNLSIVTAPAGTDHLRFTWTLPSGAGNTFQTLSSTILYRFDATQRTNNAR